MSAVYLQQFPSYSNHNWKNRPAFIFCLPWNAPVAITQNVAWMKRQFSACQTRLSMFNTFPVIRTASAKNPRFYVPQPTFLFPLETPLCGNHAICCMDGKTIQCLPNSSQHVPIYLQQFFSYSNRKNRRFHVPQPTFLFPLETPLRLSHNMLHGWKDNSMLAKLLAACTYLSSIVSKLYDV